MSRRAMEETASPEGRRAERVDLNEARRRAMREGMLGVFGLNAGEMEEVMLLLLTPRGTLLIYFVCCNAF
jgi:hypothetical protein